MPNQLAVIVIHPKLFAFLMFNMEPKLPHTVKKLIPFFKNGIEMNLVTN